ncbi:uncharacterized protein G2W53_040675 [Senna tora]|uniref:Uncharacterized protein n=1 Tax=Senna tora TaxID=362788 RepID=A0A834SE19_9FABA|nr:uncharacterized protein G2W53_040675 [Senna tora]
MARPLRQNSKYMRWYSRHTRRWNDYDLATSGHVELDPMPHGGSRRGTRGYHEVRDPILLAKEFYMGSMPQQHGFEGDAGNVGGKVAANLPQFLVSGNFDARSSNVPVVGGFGVSSYQFPLVPPSRTFREESSLPSSAKQQMPSNISEFNKYAEILSSSGYATPIQTHVNLNKSPPTTDDEGQGSQHDPEPVEMQLRHTKISSKSIRCEMDSHYFMEH